MDERSCKKMVNADAARSVKEEFSRKVDVTKTCIASDGANPRGEAAHA